MSTVPVPRLRSERLVLTLPAPARAEQVAAYFRDNRTFHGAWDPPRPAGFYTAAFWAERLERNRAELTADQSLRLFLFRRAPGDAPGEVVGTCNFTGFARGPFQACRLGYGLAEAAQGQGLMSEALGAAIPYVFKELDLHRIEANYIPTNERSGRVLRRLGFVVDGYARDYLFIAGAWRDHILTSKTREDPRPPRPSR